MPAAAYFVWQVARITDRSPANALMLSRANRTTGLLVFAACAVVGTV